KEDISTKELPSLARQLKHERRARGITQAAVGRIMDVALPTYAGWEAGRTTPSRHFFVAIAKFLDLSEAALADLCAVPLSVDTTGWPPLGKLIGTKREELRLTRTALAEALGASPSTIAAWELGYRVPRPHQQRKLADALKVDLGVLAHLMPR